jgi:hypothetical protein
MARKAGHWQTAYSATLQARQSGDLSTQIQSAKLVKAMGEPHRALQELEGSLRLFGVVGTDVIDITEDENDIQTRAKVKLPFICLERSFTSSHRHFFCALAGCKNPIALIQTRWAKSLRKPQKNTSVSCLKIMMPVTK